MRVAVVSTSFPRDADDAAGCFVQAAAAEEAARGHDVHVIAPGRRFARRPQRRGPLWIHRTGGDALFGWPGAVAKVRRAPWRALAAVPFAAGARLHLRDLAPLDLVIAHWIVPSAWPLLAATAWPIEVVAHGADIRLLQALPRRLSATIIRALLNRGAAFRFAAHDGRETLLSTLDEELRGTLRDRSRVAPLPLGLPERGALTAAGQALRAQLRLDADEPFVVCVGRLVAAKRFDAAIRALRACPRAPRLVVVGDGPERPELEQLAGQLEIRASFTGLLPRTGALALIATAAALLHPSSHEAAPTVIREARALAVPVIACAAGDVARWAEEDAGLVVAGFAPAELAAALEQLLRP